MRLQGLNRGSCSFMVGKKWLDVWTQNSKPKPGSCSVKGCFLIFWSILWRPYESSSIHRVFLLDLICLGELGSNMSHSISVDIIWELQKIVPSIKRWKEGFRNWVLLKKERARLWILKCLMNKHLIYNDNTLKKEECSFSDRNPTVVDPTRFYTLLQKRELEKPLHISIKGKCDWQPTPG